MVSFFNLESVSLDLINLLLIQLYKSLPKAEKKLLNYAPKIIKINRNNTISIFLIIYNFLNSPIHLIFL